MKRILSASLLLALVASFGWTMFFLYQKGKKPSEEVVVEKPFVASILKKTVATGAIVPRKEITIKPRVSGIVEELFVQPGEKIESGATLAKIRVIPDVLRLNEAEAALSQRRISYQEAKENYLRYQGLKGVASEAEIEQKSVEHNLRREEMRAALSNLELIREGASVGGKVSNLVLSTVSGMILEVPVREGGTVIESNTFNDGTTIATVADMGDMIFEGTVDETEVGKIREGLKLNIRIGALEELTFSGVLEFISPKGILTDGSIQFGVRASIEQREGVFVRAGYSANASIVLDKRENVLAIHESLLQFEGERAFVEVETSPESFERRFVELGLSDGIQIEVKDGLTAESRIKKPTI